ncbi:MAG: helix-turn-helix transcriptional regulator [Pseudomonadota bacterium]
MAIDHLPDNLRLLCSYGRSTSEVCRRAGINRQQFSKYLNGQAQPSLSTLRRICDFFGVDDNEILLDRTAFKELIRLRPPRLGNHQTPIEHAVERLIQPSSTNLGLLEAHEGFYHSYVCSDASRGYIHRSLSRIHRQGDVWMCRTIERHLAGDFMVPSRLKYDGIILESQNRLVTCEREQGSGRTLWCHMLYTSDHPEPTFLSGLILGIWPDGTRDIHCARTVWQYLGRQPDVRTALRQCGPLDPRSEDLPEFVRHCTDNTRAEGDFAFFARF